MQTSKEVIKKQGKLRVRGCKALCCSGRISLSSSPEEAESSNCPDRFQTSNCPDRFQTISRAAHAMVQKKLDLMIREREEARNKEGRTWGRREETNFVVMLAVEKASCNPREDFRESIEEMIVANRIEEAKDLRRLLNYYLTMNSEEFRGIILDVFHDVCADLFVHFQM